MKRPETMIREHELSNPPQSKSARFYTYIRPLKNGEMTIEVHAAVNAKRKGEPLMTKRVFKMRTDKSRYERRDCLWYENWSTAAPPPHWVVDFHESGRGVAYMAKAYRADEHLIWDADYCRRKEWKHLAFPHGTMLNDFSKTNYKYCGYTTRTGLSIAEYLYLWDISPKVELLSKAGLYKLLDEEAIIAFTDNSEFAKWLVKNVDEARSRQWDFKKCRRLYGKKLNMERAEKLEQERAAKRRAEEARRKKLIIEERVRKSAKDAEAILALYNKIKWICGVYKTFEVRVPKDNVEMVNEGELMHNCIGAVHTSRVAAGSEVCVFLYRDGKPYLDVAISTKTFKVLDVRRTCNEEASESEKKIADEIAKKVSIALRNAA